MSGVDLSVFRFDYDLTFCGLLMNADGTIYHVYGGRDATGPQSHLSLASLVNALSDGLVRHAAYQKAPRPPKLGKKRVIEDYAPMQRRKQPECVHCHTVHEIQREDAREKGQFNIDDIWIFPDPVQVGLGLDRDDQTRVTRVDDGSAAAKAGLEVGDHLVTVDGRNVGTFGDVQTRLHHASGKATRIPLVWKRGDTEKRGTLALKKGWKEATPEVFAWRPSKWSLTPAPGFGGPVVDAETKRELEIPEACFAFRVQYIVTWGPKAHTGRNAHAAGIRKNDVVYAVCGKDDFTGMDHFHAWFRLTQKPGTTCEIKLVRGGEHKTIRLPVID